MPQLTWLDTVDSTNDEMRRRFTAQQQPPRGRHRPAASPLRQFDSIATLEQTAGRGRLDRQWIDTPGASLALSTYLDIDNAAATSLGWLPLIAGLALRATLTRLATRDADRISIKWPNDLLIGRRKTAGILGEVLGATATGVACVIGTGINLREPEDATAPIPIIAPTASAGAAFAAAQAQEAFAHVEALAHATSLSEVGITVPPERIANDYLAELETRVSALLSHGGDAAAAGLAAELAAHLGTLGQRVRVQRVHDADLVGEATGIGPGGELLLRDDFGDEHEIRAGDVHHLRREQDARREDARSADGRDGR